MRTGRRLALIASAMILIGSLFRSLAGHESAIAATVGGQSQKDLAWGSSVSVGGTLYFRADDGTHGFELWKIDGTQAGAVMVKDIRSGPRGSGFDDYGDVTSIGTTLFFVANDGLHGEELWKSDGTRAGTVLVKDIWPGTHGFARGYGLTTVGGTLFFVASDGSHGRELWKSDGTRAGTVMVKDIRPGSPGSRPGDLIDFKGTLFFSADDGSHGLELWKSDGTTAGTILVKDMAPGPAGSSPAELTKVGDTLYFIAAPNTSIWKSDGTNRGTVRVSSTPNGACYPEQLTAVGDTLYFNTADRVHGEELWKSDGTRAGTMMVKDIWPGHPLAFDDPCQYGPQGLTDLRGTLYLFPDDGTHGEELWKSDGIEAGTVLVKDINPGEAASATYNRQRITNVEGTLYFGADDGTHGYELWKSDGIGAGTALVRDIYQNAEVSNPRYLLSALTNVGETLYFAAADATHGYELWRSDGTEIGTVMAQDVNPGIQGSFPFDPLSVPS